MIRITNITDEPIQRHLILFEEEDIITLILRFYPKTQHWTFDIEFKDKAIYGIKLSTGVLHMTSKNLPFDFFVVDGSGLGFDPFQRDDFASGRCRLYMMETEDMKRIRNGADVDF